MNGQALRPCLCRTEPGQAPLPGSELQAGHRQAHTGASLPGCRKDPSAGEDPQRGGHGPGWQVTHLPSWWPAPVPKEEKKIMPTARGSRKEEVTLRTQTLREQNPKQRVVAHSGETTLPLTDHGLGPMTPTGCPHGQCRVCRDPRPRAQAPFLAQLLPERPVSTGPRGRTPRLGGHRGQCRPRGSFAHAAAEPPLPPPGAPGARSPNSDRGEGCTPAAECLPAGSPRSLPNPRRK